RLTFRRGHVTSARFMPDGQTIVYGAAWDGGPITMYSRRLENPESTPLASPPGDILSVSKQGELAVALGRRDVEWFITPGDRARMPLSGAAPRAVLDGVQEADWTPDGRGLVVARDLGGRFQIELSNGTVLYETPGWVSHVRMSPDGA